MLKTTDKFGFYKKDDYNKSSSGVDWKSLRFKANVNSRNLTLDNIDVNNNTFENIDYMTGDLKAFNLQKLVKKVALLRV